jgi:hypothetical protein
VEIRVELRGSAGEAVEVSDRDGRLLRALDVDGGVGARATFISEGFVAMQAVGSLCTARASCVVAVEALDRGTAPGALVARGKGGIHE